MSKCRIISRLFTFSYLWLILFSNMQTEPIQQSEHGLIQSHLDVSDPLVNFWQRLPLKPELLTISPIPTNLASFCL